MTSREDKKALKLRKKENKRVARAEKKEAKRAKRAAFWEYKFLKTKRFLKVEKHRENVKFLLNTTYKLTAVFAAIIVGLLVGLPACLAAGTVAGVTAGLAVGSFLFVLQIVIPATIKEFIRFRKARFVRVAQAKEAEKWYHNKVAEKITLKQKLAHSKADINRNKALAKNDKRIQKENIKKQKKATKQALRTQIDSDFHVEVKDNAETNTHNVKLK